MLKIISLTITMLLVLSGAEAATCFDKYYQATRNGYGEGKFNSHEEASIVAKLTCANQIKFSDYATARQGLSDGVGSHYDALAVAQAAGNGSIDFWVYTATVYTETKGVNEPEEALELAKLVKRKVVYLKDYFEVREGLGKGTHTHHEALIYADNIKYQR